MLDTKFTLPTAAAAAAAVADQLLSIWLHCKLAVQLWYHTASHLLASPQ
jgi:hypothetical protein